MISNGISMTKSIPRWAARQVTGKSERRGVVAAALSKESDGVSCWQAMGIAWGAGTLERLGDVSRHQQGPSGGRAGRVREAVVDEARATGWRERLDGAASSHEVSTGDWGLGAGLKGVNAEHESETAGRALVQ